MKKNFGLLIFVFGLFSFSGFTQTSQQKKLLNEYSYLYNRIKYVDTCGFCFDGEKTVTQIKTKGTEHSVFIENPNLYLKVIRQKDKKIFFTRCFELVEVGRRLGINENYVLHQNISIKKGCHWNFLQLGSKLNITTCTNETCENIKVEFYETNEKPLTVEDGIFLTFNSMPKKASSVKAITNSTSKPNLDRKSEIQKMDELLNKMEKVFDSKKIKELRATINSIK